MSLQRCYLEILPVPGAVSGPGQRTQAPSSCAAPSFPGYWVRSGGSGHWVGDCKSYTVCAFMFPHCPEGQPQNFRSRTAPGQCSVLSHMFVNICKFICKASTTNYIKGITSMTAKYTNIIFRQIWWHCLSDNCVTSLSTQTMVTSSSLHEVGLQYYICNYRNYNICNVICKVSTTN